jgi:serine/threonine protein kinase
MSKLIFYVDAVFAIPGYLNLVEGEDYEIQRERTFGAGGTATTVLGKVIQNGQDRLKGILDIAIKRFTDGYVNAHPEDFFYEVALIASIPKSPFVVDFLGYSDSPEKRIIMKLYDGCLSKLISHHRIRFTPSLVMKIVREIAKGLKVIHDAGIVHLDLKPSKYFFNTVHATKWIT